MISPNAQPTYDAYWNAYRKIRSSGLQINVDPGCARELADAHNFYLRLQGNLQVSFDFNGFHAYYLETAQYVAHVAAQAMGTHPTGVDLGVLADGVRDLGNVLGVDLTGNPHLPQQTVATDLFS